MPTILTKVGLCFHFEDKDRDFWQGHQIDLDLWRLPGKRAGCFRFAVIDKSSAQYRMGDSELLAEEYHASLAAFEAAHAGDTFVYLESAKTLVEAGVTGTSIADYPFDFDVMTWWITGPAQGFQPQPGDGKTYVYVPAVNAEVGVHAHTIGAEVMTYIGYRWLLTQQA